ncbi:MAG: rhodanese-like domain-containing protein [Gammaproteobacteria bacterium]|jgi:rhodanese-related sulfurtransferase
METITAEGLKELLTQNPNLYLLDVREPWEFELCHIEGSINIPMTELMGKLDTLDQSRETIVICHHGARSFQVAGFLENTGFERVTNLEGGVAAWASQVEPDMPKY